TQVRVSSDWSSNHVGRLTVQKGDVVTLHRVYPGGWWTATNSQGVQGLIPQHVLNLGHDIKVMNKDKNMGNNHKHKVNASKEEKQEYITNEVKNSKINLNNVNNYLQDNVSNIARRKRQQLVKARVLYNWQSQDKDYLTIRQNDIITVTKNVGGWWQATDNSGMSGLVPANYVK
ncbi:unnamed protein product, partial [Meganyctiphanes norvegica]